MSSNYRQAGMSLIEVVVFIVVLGIGFTGILVLYNQVTKASVDPIVRKQALAIASSLLEEIELRAFTYCDPDDPAVFTASSVADCSLGKDEKQGAETFSPPGTETRYSNTARFDNVNDYHGFTMLSGIQDITNSTVPGLGGYQVTNVSVAPISPGELPDVADTTAALRITVTVTGPTNMSVSLQGYRLRYAPTSP
jgi:MSHA pilin protein MshD